LSVGCTQCRAMNVM